MDFIKFPLTAAPGSHTAGKMDIGSPGTNEFGCRFNGDYQLVIMGTTNYVSVSADKDKENHQQSVIKQFHKNYFKEF